MSTSITLNELEPPKIFISSDFSAICGCKRVCDEMDEDRRLITCEQELPWALARLI